MEDVWPDWTNTSAANLTNTANIRKTQCLFNCEASACDSIHMGELLLYSRKSNKTRKMYIHYIGCFGPIKECVLNATGGRAITNSKMDCWTPDDESSTCNMNRIPLKDTDTWQDKSPISNTQFHCHGNEANCQCGNCDCRDCSGITLFTDAPTSSPTNSPSHPTITPSKSPSPYPSLAPSTSPTIPPSNSPTHSPTPPTSSPSHFPSNAPFNSPTNVPSNSPTGSPSTLPSNSPTPSPTNSPANSPTFSPSTHPTNAPSPFPTDNPSHSPTTAPTEITWADIEVKTFFHPSFFFSFK